MKYDIIIAGVGGQGVLSVAAAIARAAMASGLSVKQSEVHGMAQRGGAVQAHFRLSDGPIASDLIGKGRADMILSMEPMEALRYLPWLRKGGVIVTDSNPFRNIPDYPDIKGLEDAIRAIPGSCLIDSKELAKRACNPKGANMVIVGAASRHLPIAREALEAAIRELFESKGNEVADANIACFALGREA
jgi:indolepyruvate ferredoxin oxidoreductase beta subunit